MYLPLTLLISLQLHDRKFELPRWSCLVLGLGGVLLGHGALCSAFFGREVLG